MTGRVSAHRAVGVVLAAGLLGIAGCSPGVDATYGRSRGVSVNGTGVFANLLRGRGHTIRVARRLNEQVADWAETIVRFSPRPGPIGQEEGNWYLEWLEEDSSRRLIYVCRDFDAESEYWARVLKVLPQTADPRLRQRAEARRKATASWVSDLPSPAQEPADPDVWFGIQGAKSHPVVCRSLSGPWAQGIDPQAAALTRHESIKPGSEEVLLEGDGQILAIEWHWFEGSQVLVIANGSFLLNETLVHRERRPLALRVVDWAGAQPRKIAFAEGLDMTTEAEEKAPSPFAILGISPFNWVLGHLFACLLIASLSRAMILGRPRPEPSSGADRPAAHPEALGALLARTRDAATARSILDAYHRWRHPSAHTPQTRTPR